ncbi:MAG: hypothetical protein QM811_07985 [Pirellulales bacterium]
MRRTFTLLGIVTFATVFPWGLLVYKTEAVAETLGVLSPLIVLSGAPALMVGILCLQKMSRRRNALLQTIGIAIGVLGAATMQTAMIAAWPMPVRLLPTMFANAAIFAVLAWRYCLPAAHFVAGAYVMFATVLGVQTANGLIDWHATDGPAVVRTLASGSSGTILTALAPLFWANSFAARKFGRDDDVRWIDRSAMFALGVGLSLVTAFGFARAGDPADATWTYAAVAAVAGIYAWITARRDYSMAAVAVSLLALIQAIVFRDPDHWGFAQPWTAAFLSHASIGACWPPVAVGRARWCDDWGSHSPMRRSRLRSSV